MKNIIDISPEISSQLAVWPGDTPFSQRFLMSFSESNHLDLSTVQSTVHLGAHTDAPSHYSATGETMEQRALNFYIGDCQVIAVSTPRGERVLPEHLLTQVQSERVLVFTNSYPNPETFNEDFCSLSPELIEHFASHNVVLVGIDTPSVDPFSSKALESHNALLKHNMAVLEGVVLSHVSPGFYFLSALPLKIKGSDASPVRAILIEK